MMSATEKVLERPLLLRRAAPTGIKAVLRADRIAMGAAALAIVIDSDA